MSRMMFSVDAIQNSSPRMIWSVQRRAMSKKKAIDAIAISHV